MSFFIFCIRMPLKLSNLSTLQNKVVTKLCYYENITWKCSSIVLFIQLFITKIMFLLPRTLIKQVYFFLKILRGKSRSAILLESRIQAIRELCLVLVESMSVIVRVHVCYWLFPCLLLVESMSVIGCFHVCYWLSPCLLLVESMSVIKDTWVHHHNSKTLLFV